MQASSARLCHLYVNDPGHAFDQALKAEGEQVAGELSRQGFPIDFEVRYARGDDQTQQQQIEADRRSPRPPDLYVIIPVNQDAVYALLSRILGAQPGSTCVFLHQPLRAGLRLERQDWGLRLLSVSADQVEIGRIQGRQLAALLPGGKGSLLYVQGKEQSYATRHRLKGMLEQMARTPGLKLNGFRVYGDWSSASVRPAVEGWKQLGGRLEWVEAAAAQNDDMAIALAGLVRERGIALPVVGVDGLTMGKRAVDDGVLSATVVQPLAIGHVLRTYRDLLAGNASVIPDDGNVLVTPESYPPLDSLRPSADAKGGLAGGPR
jgi:ABC-type sugar transport system substrate-binding protein